MTPEPCPQGRTDCEACMAPFRYCPVIGCERMGTPPTCQKKRELGTRRAYTLACIRKAGHDGLHRDPLSNVEWATNDGT